MMEREMENINKAATIYILYSHAKAKKIIDTGLQILKDGKSSNQELLKSIYETKNFIHMIYI